MELLTEFIAVVLIGLASILAAIGGAAAVRYRDARLALVTAALAGLGLIGVLALIGELSPAYGEPFQVAPIPLGVAVVAVALLYAALIRGRGQSIRS